MGRTLVNKGHSELVTDEVEAIEGYDSAINDESNPENKRTLEHIRDEELEHIDELEGMDKMTSDEAWNDFKSNYDPKEFDQAHKAVFDDNLPESEMATVDGKLDTIASMVNEVKTDTKILANVAPKLQAQTELQEDQLETDTESEEETFGGDIDIFGDDTAEGGDEEMTGEDKDVLGGEDNDVGEQGAVDEGQPAEDQTEKEGEEIALSDGEEEGEQQAEEGSEEEQPAEEGKEEPADEEQSEDDELTEKMVNTIVRQSTDIKALKSQIKELTAKIERMEKSLTKSNTVQRPARAVRQKSPMITKRIGVVSKPPVSSGYTGTYNRRDGETAKADWSNPKSIVDGYKKQLQE